ncbi:MAG: hypothetical protein GXP25_19840 [Planctomycetes bacterium]|nr:hypothetical protein [Planctomycetota bacterium]
MRARFLIAIAVVVLAAVGCGPTISDFPKQEFVLRKEPVVHLAIRGSRMDRKLTCQFFLLTMNRSLWISGVDLKLKDGTYLDPKRIESIDDIEGNDSPRMWVGMGAGYGRGYPYYPYYPYYRRYWYHGSYPYYRTGAGTCVPTWYLLGRSGGDYTPDGLEFTYELPASQKTCEGMQLVVHVALKRKKKKAQEAEKKPKEASGKNVTKDGAEVIAQREREIRYPFAFSLAEKPHPPPGQEKRSPKDIVYEIEFTHVAKETTR